MKAALVVNDRAGSLSGLVAPRASLEAALRDAGFDLVAMATDATLQDQWAAVAASPAEIVFVAGGDGTLRDGAERLIGTERIFAPLPGGTMNRVCARLGLSDDPVRAARDYRPGPSVALDVATANGQVFLYQSVVGAPTRLMRFREMQRGGGTRGWLPLARALLRELFRPSSRGLSIRLGAGRRARGHAAVVTMPEPGRPAGLALALARPRGPRGRIRQAWRWFRGRLSEDPDVAAREGDRLAVHGSAPWLRLSLDGETRISPSPVRFRLHRGALRVLAPPRAA
ncbi:diacylglycerol kinase family protein [Roseococcus sp. SYP-B2431]|uniref:diacylglycerol/lipid kinase family protein n=1 Tax=Roseococcus sp. SYP-B2431 TaxID=2496640 RepID=UPI0013F43558|nr:diacylglycerol kinase family protein [Roseococcus sp. SYP-B2431]